MATFTETVKQEGELVKEVLSRQVSFESCIVVNGEASAYADVQIFGLPIQNLTRVSDNHYTADLVLAADVASTKGIITANGVYSFAATGNTGDRIAQKKAVIVRGPAVLNKNAIAKTDPAGAAYNVDAIVTALLALGITVRTIPDKTVGY